MFFETTGLDDQKRNNLVWNGTSGHPSVDIHTTASHTNEWSLRRSAWSVCRGVVQNGSQPFSSRGNVFAVSVRVRDLLSARRPRIVSVRCCSQQRWIVPEHGRAPRAHINCYTIQERYRADVDVRYLRARVGKPISSVGNLMTRTKFESSCPHLERITRQTWAHDVLCDCGRYI